MPIVLILVLIGLGFIEFKLISTVYTFIAHRYDAFSAVFLIILSFFLGLSVGVRLIKNVTRTRKPLHVFAGLLLIIPGYLSDFAALFLLFPPTGWAFNKLAAKMMQRLMKSSNFAMYTNVGGFGGQSSQSQYKYRDNAQSGGTDSTIIDVEAFDTNKKLN